MTLGKAWDDFMDLMPVEGNDDRPQLGLPDSLPRLLGASPPMLKLHKMICKVSQNQYPVLIQGESGTGKELVAHSIHDSGPLARQPFLPIDCGSLVSTLIESELFGYERGAFTGADRRRAGLLEAAGGGTVFLDEIGEMPLALQSKFLRALQEKEVRPLGSNRQVHIQARIIAASNRDLDDAVRQGSFRKDLYFRLNVVSLWLPPLRERRSDIPLLANHLVEKHQPAGQQPLVFSEGAMKLLMNYDWPGNVRELENCIERVVALGSGPLLQVGDLPSSIRCSHRLPEAFRSSSSVAEDPLPPGNGSAPDSPYDPVVPWAECEKRAILGALKKAGGDRILAARLLEIGKTTVYRNSKSTGSWGSTSVTLDRWRGHPCQRGFCFEMPPARMPAPLMFY